MSEFIASVREEFLASMRVQFLSSMSQMTRKYRQEDGYIDATLDNTHIKGGNDWKSEFPASVLEEFLASVRKDLLASMREEARMIVREEISREISAAAAEITVKMAGSKQQTNVNDPDMVCVLSEEGDKDDNEDNYTVQRKRKRDNPISEVDIPCFTVDLFKPPPHDEKDEFDKWIKVGLNRNK